MSGLKGSLDDCLEYTSALLGELQCARLIARDQGTLDDDLYLLEDLADDIYSRLSNLQLQHRS
jgi:hypothetical protein